MFRRDLERNYSWILDSPINSVFTSARTRRGSESTGIVNVPDATAAIDEKDA
jgi:hypothetical protein